MDKDNSGNKRATRQRSKKSLLKNNTGNKNEIKKGAY